MPDPTSDTSLDETVLDETLLEVSLAAAREAARLQREMAGRLDPTEWSEKATSDFVTEVDRESERLILARILDRFPDHEIMAEEGTSGQNPGSFDPSPPAGALDPGRAAATLDPGPRVTPLLWVVDPLDGTTNWLHGYPEYAVSIATLDGRGLRTGVVVNSATGEEFTAIRGRGARRDGEPIHVSTVAEPRLALLGTGFPFKKSELLPGYLCALETMLRKTSGVRRAGAAALDLCDLACGRLDGFWEHWLMEWDVAAGALIVGEAGGTFGPLPEVADPDLAEAITGGKRAIRAFDGRGPLAPAHGGGYLAGNGLLEPALADIWMEAVGGG